MTESKVEKIVIEIYTSLYLNSTPSVDFNNLIETSPIDKEGNIRVPYENHQISYSKYLEILNEIKAKYRLSKRVINSINVSILLGVCPVLKMNE